MLFNKITIQDSIPLVFGVILIVIVFFIIITSFSTLNSTEQKIITPTPIINMSPTPDQNSVYEAPPIYNLADQEKLLEKIEKRTKLSESDTLAKTRILSVLSPNQDYGILYETATIRIDYTRGQDLFQVEILTTNINTAKGEGNAWFREQGMSQDGICNHPVDFYLSWEVKEQLEGKIVSFSPLAPNCK